MVCAAPAVRAGRVVRACYSAGWRFELVLEWLGLFEMLLFERFEMRFGFIGLLLCGIDLMLLQIGSCFCSPFD